MSEPIKNPKGINFKEDPVTGTLDIGINIDQMIETLESYRRFASPTGWININGFRNRTTYNKNDYSHTPKLKHPDFKIEETHPKRIEEWKAKKQGFNIGGCNSITWEEGVKGLEKE